MSPFIVPPDAEDGFALALIVPAAASTLKQAQREAAGELHVLADYHRVGRAAGCPPHLSPREKAAAKRVGCVVAEQGINGATFFLAVKAAVALGGVDGGVLTQLGITLNTMLNPRQTQAMNPARMIFREIGRNPDWVDLLPEAQRRRFADSVGKFATKCGYGGLRGCDRNDAPLVPQDTVRTSWDTHLDEIDKSRLQKNR